MFGLGQDSGPAAPRTPNTSGTDIPSASGNGTTTDNSDLTTDTQSSSSSSSSPPPIPNVRWGSKLRAVNAGEPLNFVVDVDGEAGFVKSMHLQVRGTSRFSDFRSVSRGKNSVTFKDLGRYVVRLGLRDNEGRETHSEERVVHVYRDIPIGSMIDSEKGVQSIDGRLFHYAYKTGNCTLLCDEGTWPILERNSSTCRKITLHAGAFNPENDQAVARLEIQQDAAPPISLNLAIDRIRTVHTKLKGKAFSVVWHSNTNGIGVVLNGSANCYSRDGKKPA